MNSFTVKEWNIGEQSCSLFCSDIEKIKSQRIDQAIWIAVIDQQLFLHATMCNVDPKSIRAEIEPK